MVFATVLLSPARQEQIPPQSLTTVSTTAIMVRTPNYPPPNSKRGPQTKLTTLIALANASASAVTTSAILTAITSGGKTITSTIGSTTIFAGGAGGHSGETPVTTKPIVSTKSDGSKTTIGSTTIYSSITAGAGSASASKASEASSKSASASSVASSAASSAASAASSAVASASSAASSVASSAA